MEEGQKIDINLESPLDTKSSDMLVSVKDTKFAHNRQKFQGHVLPTSLRYERNGWAAGWYVYDFKMGGGYIFSKNETPVIEGGEWLAANRSKINNTPTYVISFYTARNDNDADTPDNRTELKQYADAVKDIQFQAWFTDTASINARECEEAEIDFMPVPKLSFNYAVEDNDYRNVIQFTPFKNISINGPAGVEFDTGDCFETLSPDADHSADLTMEFVSRADDGTVTAVLNNNEVRWQWEEEVYIPKDLVDDEGNKFGKFVDVTNEVVNWKLGNKQLQYDDAQNKFIYDEVNYNPGANLEIFYNIPVTYTIPFSKYYSELKGITWSVQGTNNLFSTEGTDVPTNMYKISTDIIEANSVTVYDGALSEQGIDGPDISVVSELKLPLTDLPSNNGNPDYQTNSHIEDTLTHITNSNVCIVPFFNTVVKNFILPGEDSSNARDVMLQLYYKYPGHWVSNVGTIQGSSTRMSVMTYKSAAVGAYNEIVYTSNGEVDYSKYSLDGKSIDNNSDGLYVGNKILWGRAAELSMTISAINGVYFPSGDPMTINCKGINSSLIFNKLTEANVGTSASNNISGPVNPLTKSFKFMGSQGSGSQNTFIEIPYFGELDEDNEWIWDTDSDYYVNYMITYTRSDGTTISLGDQKCTYNRLIYHYDNTFGTHIWQDYIDSEYVDGGSHNQRINVQYRPYIHSGLSWDDDTYFSQGGLPLGAPVNAIRFWNYTNVIPRKMPSALDQANGFNSFNCDGVSDDWYENFCIYTPSLVDANGHYVIPLCLLDASALSSFANLGPYSHLARNNLPWLCAVHNHDSIGMPLASGMISPAYGFAIMRWTDVDAASGVKAGVDNINTQKVRVNNLTYINNVSALNLYTLCTDTDSNNGYVPFSIRTTPSIEHYLLVQGISGGVNKLFAVDLNGSMNNANLFIQLGLSDSTPGTPYIYYWNNIPAYAVDRITVNNNKIELRTAGRTYYYDKSLNDFWVTAINNARITLNKANFFNNVCMDIMELATGKLLVDHRKDTVDVTSSSTFKVNLSPSALIKGRIFYNQPFDINTDWQTTMQNTSLSELYRRVRYSGAFFPVCKHRYGSTDSIYRNDVVYGGCQGVALFNTVGISDDVGADYHMLLLSPLSSYILPPTLDTENNCARVYAGKTYTHHITFKDTVSIYNYKFISNNSTNTELLEVRPRDNLYNEIDYRFEDNNTYYIEGKTFLTPAAISCYNGQLHITYKAAPGNTVVINGSSRDTSTADLSVKQEADLIPIYLLKYVDETAKYNFVIGNHDDVLLVKETKEVINTIADTRKHWVEVSLSDIDFTGDSPVVTLQFKEYHDNDNNESNNSELSPVNVRTITYDKTLNHQEAFINKEYTDETQIVVNSNVDGITTIMLPVIPAGSHFKYDINSEGVYIIDDTDTTNRFKYNFKDNSATEMYIKGKQLAKADVKLITADVSNVAYNVYTLKVDQNINTYVYFRHYGIYRFNGLTTDTITPKVKELSYNPSNKREINIKVSDLVYVGRAEPIPVGINTAYTLDLNHFDDKAECTPKFLDYSATDVRDDNPDTQTKQFARVMADSEYQLIKQHWDSTVATECFWWIDPTHTLELIKDRFILKSKVTDGSYDDWMGDKWETVYELPRTDYLTSEADTFICSSANGRGARSYLYVLQPYTANSIKVIIYDPLNNMSEVFVRTITFKHVELATKKKSVALNSVNDCTTEDYVVGTYSDIVSSSLLADSKLSAVCINGTHWLGIQYDKNFNQWAFAFGNNQRIIQGYGCVGINKYATGGMIPVKYFNGTGFNDAVYNINELEAETDKTISSLDEFNIFKERVVGDENQQWYISEELKDIVMAVDLDSGMLIKLPLTNTYAQIYSSPSYVKYTIHALGIQIKQLMNLFTDEDNPIWKEIMMYAMFPLVWYLSPYTNIINYLQQTLGQYAYVHYNSTSIGKQGSKAFTENTDGNAGLSEDAATSHIDALTTDDLSFDVLHIPQEQSFKDSAWDNILGIFASMVVSATDYAMKDLTVNSLQNQSAVNDIGKKFSQSFLQNIGSMSVTGFNMQSTKPMLKSEVTAVKTLDMFYSTSAQQNCFAGPGYVNMQFVAQCTAQSVTSVQLEAQQTQVFMLLRQLTTWQGKAVIFVLDILKDFMFKMSDNMAGGLSVGMVVGLGWIGALVTSAVGYALVAAKSLVKLGIETVDSMLDSFFPGGIKTNVTAQLSRHNYDIEGKHAYGNKSESFMWPCADCSSKLFTDESVEAVLQDKSWPLEMPKATTGNMQFKPIYSDQPKCFTITPDIMNSQDWEGKVPYSIAMCKGKQKRRALPDSTAYVVGTESFMPTVPFKNENIGEGEPVFTPPPVQDYIIDKNWNIFVTAMAGDALWVSCKDTKLFDGNYSNIVVTDSFCGIAAPHVAVEVKRNICEEYLRPWAVSPDAIALNITGLNCAYDEVAYHAFDGYGYRITDWLGSSGMNKEHYTLQYCFQVNDRFKRSNKLPPNQFMGNFQAVPSMSLDIKDKIFNDIQVTTEERGMRTGVAGENKDTQRYSLPIFTEQISSLPAIVRALSPYKLAVIDGITSLTTDVRISQSVYKIPDSVDFNINDKLYRMTNEYICSVDHDKGLEVVKYLVPALGLTYLGATPFMAYFYNQATRQYYIYQGGNTLQVMDMLERFHDIKSGTYDFINQEVVMPCLATMTRLDNKVKDDGDETDNIVIPVFRHNNVGGELTPPVTTIFNTESWYRTISTPAGLVFQGPNRCIINRFIWSQYMLKDIKANKGKWKKVPREEYHPFRTYSQQYETMPRRIASDAVKGWTHNPFLLVTSPLGLNEETDCKFEWEITFAWTTEMEQLYEHNEYVTVNVMAETMSAGGKVFSRPTHIFLHKELFARSNNFGYYSFRYQGNNGMGNRERLHIWSDGYIAISSLQLEYKIMTEKRSEMLVIQEDLKGMKEM